MKNGTHRGLSPSRWLALDDLRGLAILIMVPVNTAMTLVNIPSWFKHAPDTGMTVADLVVPVFLVSLGVSASISLKRRIERQGQTRSILHAVLRSVILFTFGLIGNLLVYAGKSWEVLQMLGAVNLYTLPFLFIAPRIRVAVAAAIVVLLEVLRPHGFGWLIGTYWESGLGGPWGTPLLGFLSVAASAVGETMQRREGRWRVRFLLAIASGFAFVAVAFSIFGGPQFAISKHSLSLTYILFGGTAAAALFAATVWWREIQVWRLPAVGGAGRNALLVYMGSGILILVVRADFFPQDLSPPLAWLTCVAMLSFWLALCRLLDRQGWYLRL